MNRKFALWCEKFPYCTWTHGLHPPSIGFAFGNVLPCTKSKSIKCSGTGAFRLPSTVNSSWSSRRTTDFSHICKSFSATLFCSHAIILSTYRPLSIISKSSGRKKYFVSKKISTNSTRDVLQIFIWLRHFYEFFF